jgi:hypothetical protein
MSTQDNNDYTDYLDYVARAESLATSWGLFVTDDPDRPAGRVPDADELKAMMAEHLEDLENNHSVGDWEAVKSTLEDYTRTVELALTVELRDQAYANRNW